MRLTRSSTSLSLSLYLIDTSIPASSQYTLQVRRPYERPDIFGDVPV